MAWFKWLLLCLVLFGPLGIDIYLPAIPAIAQSLDTPAALIQSTVSLFLLMMGLGQLLAGPMADRLGRRPVALAGIVIYLFGALLAVNAGSGWLFVASRLVQGIAVCGTAVVAFAAVRDRLDGPQSAQAYSFLNGALNVVPALAPLLGGLLAERFNWQAPFWFMALYALCMLLVVWWWLPETRPESTQDSSSIPVARYKALLGQKPFLAFALVNAGGMGMVNSYVSLAPTVLMTQAGLSPVAFSLVFGVNALWILLSSLLASRLIRHFGRLACLKFAVAALALAVVALFASRLCWPLSAWGYMLPVAFACTGFACLLGPATSLALAPFANEAGVASALLLCLQMAGGALIGLLAVAAPIAPQWSLWVTMVLALWLTLRSLKWCGEK